MTHHAPGISSTALYNQIHISLVSSEETASLLEEHKNYLFRAIKLVPDQSDDHLNEIKYRRGTDSTLRFPHPTPAELICIDSLKNRMNLSTFDAALLLRDFLEHLHGEALCHVLEKSTDFTDSAPIATLEMFYKQQREASFSCLVVVLINSIPDKKHPLQAPFQRFISQNLQTLRHVIIESSISVISSYDISNTVSASMAYIQRRWVLELLFSLSMSQGLQVGEKKDILTTYSLLAQRNSAFKVDTKTSHGRSARAYMDGSEISALLAASLNVSNRLESIIHATAKRASAQNESLQPSDPFSVCGDESNITQFNKLYSALHCDPSWETALLTLSWASFLQLRSQWGSNHMDDSTTDGKSSFQHMSFSLSCNVFLVLQKLSNYKLLVNELTIGDLFRCFWNDVISFLTAFPPQQLGPTSVIQIVDLSTSILSQSDEIFRSQVSDSLWDNENSNTKFVGANILLRLASSIYPLSFQPLINMLTILAIDKRTSAYVTDFLEYQLRTVSERSEGYQSLLLAVDEESEKVWESLTARNGAVIKEVAQTFSMVSPSGPETVFVQADQALVADSYRPKLPRGCVGLSSSTFSTVTWVIEWNGLGAVSHILHVFLTMLGEEEVNLLYSHDVLSELLCSVVSSMKLIDRICRTASNELRNHLTEHTQVLTMVANIVRELSDPGDRARQSWLTKERQALLLNTSSLCLAAMVTGSHERARYALEHLESSSKILPIQAALKSLGESSFPAISALCQITIACSNGAMLPQDLERVSFSATTSPGRRTSWDSLQRFHRVQSRVLKFLGTSALSVWFTISAKAINDDDSFSLHWLLPACSLQLLSYHPELVLEEPMIGTVLAKVLTSVCDASDSKTETFLFPALRAALVSCYEVLSRRNQYLQGKTQDCKGTGESGVSIPKDVKMDDGPSVFEKVLLKPAVVNAMAVISSGCAESLKNIQFYNKCIRPDFLGYLSDAENERFLMLNASFKDCKANRVCSWHNWTADMGAKCLALLFSCLSQLGTKGDTFQLPWPTMRKASIGYWQGGGERIRKGFADRIRNEKSMAAIEFLVTAISCGQRATARSLMGPRSHRELTNGKGDAKSAVTTNNAVNETNGVDTVAKPVPPVQPTVPKENACEVLVAVVDVIQESRASWISIISRIDTSDNSVDEASMRKELGYIAIKIAACVRFLRVGWESKSNKWFRDCWRDLNVWQVLASLLQCDSSRTSDGGTIAISSSLSYDAHKALDALEGCEDGCLYSMVHEASLSVDSAAAWKGIAADVLQVFSSEILFKASEELVSLQAARKSSTTKDTNEVKLPVSLFESQPFAAFASAFTERWMHVLLSIDDSYVSETYNGVHYESNNGDDPFRSLFASRDLFVSTEQQAQSISEAIARTIGIDEKQPEMSNILCRFQRYGDIRMRFGADYAFDTPQLGKFLKSSEVSPGRARKLLGDVMLLNTLLCRRDVQVEVVTSFSAMASAALFADSFAPNHNVTLTYSSPQFGGKLCRFLSRALVCIVPVIFASSHIVSIAMEISKLMASLSARLTSEELEQSALTSVRFSTPPRYAAQFCSLAPLGQICCCIDRIVTNTQGKLGHEDLDSDRMDIVRWLLLTASRFAGGSAFQSGRDIAILARSALLSLSVGKSIPQVCAAASVALSSVLEKLSINEICLIFDAKAMHTVFDAIAALSKVSDDSDKQTASDTTSNLLLVLGQVQWIESKQSKTRPSPILRQLSGGSVQGFLPLGGEAIPSYLAASESRNPVHMVWCSCLHLSSLAIPKDPALLVGSSARNQVIRDILEFCTIHLPRITRDSLQMSGDWSGFSSTGSIAIGEGTSNIEFQSPRHLTISRVEEAELASATLLKLSNYCLQIQDMLPELMEKIISELVKYSAHAIRLIRSEPIERWIRPVTQRERERSALLRLDRDGLIIGSMSGHRSSSWVSSPSANGSSSRTPPRRSPSQALRAAVGDQSSRSSSGNIPQSPGLPLTPLLSPLPGHNSNFLSPGSPWAPYGSGLITEASLHFGEEASRSLLRGLCSALGALRIISSKLDVLVFGPSMVLTDEPAGLGVLITIQRHACAEVQRGTEPERKEYLYTIVDITMHLLVTHTIQYCEQNVLSRGAKDELRKRLSTVFSRLRTTIPPPPQHSVIHSFELDEFCKQLKET